MFKDLFLYKCLKLIRSVYIWIYVKNNNVLVGKDILI